MKKVFVLVPFLVACLAVGQTTESVRTNSTETLSVVDQQVKQGQQLADDYVVPVYDMDKGTTDKCKKALKEEDRHRSYAYEWHQDGRKKELPISCKSKTSNARGSYTAKLAPCTFKYHAITADEVKGPYLSSACSDLNVVEDLQDMKGDPIEEYVESWPDECVGDFQRCYHVDRDEKILLLHMCKHSLDLPAGTTHVSVDCTADKTKKKEQNDKDGENEQKQIEPFIKHQQKQSHEFYALVVGLATICLLSGCVCLLLVYRYGFKPYLHTLKRSKSDPELRGLTKGEPAFV